jgi:hypothetical protein
MASKRPLLPDVRLALETRFPHLVPAAVRSYPVGTVALGRSGQQPVALGRRPLLEHSHVIGTTGGGKTNFLEFLIRQVIKNGDGVCVIDPHGAHRSSLYNSLIGWLFAEGYHRKRRIHLIDPNAQSHVTGFNPLALPGPHTSVSVIADTTLQAFEKVWGDEETHGKPTIRRILKATFAALAELRLTLAEAELLLDHRDAHGVRKLALSKLTDRYARKVLADLDELALADRAGTRFRDEIVGPINRLAEFTSAPAIRRIIGQREKAIDLRLCLDRGDIILVNLSGGDAVSDADTELLGRLLTRFIFFHVKRRRTDKPFWLFIDECQRYLSGDIPNLLAEARKFSCGVTLSHQWQSQLGKPEDQTLAAVHNATNLKVSFRVKHPKEAQEIAETIIPLDLEQPVDILTKPTVVGHRRTFFNNWNVGENEAWNHSVAKSDSLTITDGETESTSDTDSNGSGWNEAQTIIGSTTLSYSDFGPFAQPTGASIGTGSSDASGTSGSSGSASTNGKATTHMVGTTSGTIISDGYSHGRSESYGASEGLEPIYQDLPSAVHNYQNALYFAAQKLRSLTAGEAYASFVDEAGMQSARIRVPFVRPVPISDRTFVAIRTLILSKSPSAIETAAAAEVLEVRERKLFADAQMLLQPRKEPEPQKFRVSGERWAKNPRRKGGKPPEEVQNETPPKEE